MHLLCIIWCWDGRDISPSLDTPQAIHEVDTVAFYEHPRAVGRRAAHSPGGWGEWGGDTCVCMGTQSCAICLHCSLPPPHRRARHLCSFPLSLETLGREPCPSLDGDLLLMEFCGKEAAAGTLRAAVRGPELRAAGRPLPSWGWLASCLERNRKEHRQLEVWRRAPQVYLPDRQSSSGREGPTDSGNTPIALWLASLSLLIVGPPA